VRNALVVAALAVTVACGDGLAPPAPPPSTVPFVELIMSIPVSSIAIGQSGRARLFGRRADGTQAEIGAPVSWSSSHPAVVAVTSTGTFSGVTSGLAELSATYQALTSRQRVEVRPPAPDDVRLRVAVMLTADRVPDVADIDRVFGLANDILFSRTGERMTRVDLFNPGKGDPRGQAQLYLEQLPSPMPDAILALSDDATATSFGGYATAIPLPAPHQNPYLTPFSSGTGRIGVAAVHFFHMYSRCGYDNALNRVSQFSFGGECRNQSNLQCVDNGRYWQCPNSLTDLYSEPDRFPACTIVHELAHPFGSQGNLDHYGTDQCTTRTGMSTADQNNRRLFQEYCGMCPDVYLNFRRR
jgi:hypothetical protein